MANDTITRFQFVELSYVITCSFPDRIRKVSVPELWNLGLVCHDSRNRFSVFSFNSLFRLFISFILCFLSSALSHFMSLPPCFRMNSWILYVVAVSGRAQPSWLHRHLPPVLFHRLSILRNDATVSWFTNSVLCSRCIIVIK